MSSWGEPQRGIKNETANRGMLQISCIMKCWHWAIFPARLQASIFASTELNFCVRNGNRWTLCGNITDFSLTTIEETFKFEKKLKHCRNLNLQIEVQALGQLVSVSWMHYCTYTSDLSTCSLQVTLLIWNDGISHLEARFTLRCLQRLSKPHAATQLCPWQNNWCTGGASDPVLSY